jgi:hypothetical protein
MGLEHTFYIMSRNASRQNCPEACLVLSVYAEHWKFIAIRWGTQSGQMTRTIYRCHKSIYVANSPTRRADDKSTVKYTKDTGIKVDKTMMDQVIAILRMNMKRERVLDYTIQFQRLMLEVCKRSVKSSVS